MRTLIILTVAFGLITTAALADTMKNCGDAWSAMSAADKAKTTHAVYSKMCLAKDYNVPAASSASAAPAGATGKCKDGTWTMATTHGGACSRHGGVESWLPGH
ncbi:MAG TPA: DUF3761 domain-containing protein [Bryobacteraceae bacterium]|jgi:hypothetical protein